MMHQINLSHFNFLTFLVKVRISAFALSEMKTPKADHNRVIVALLKAQANGSPFSMMMIRGSPITLPHNLRYLANTLKRLPQLSLHGALSSRLFHLQAPRYAAFGNNTSGLAQQ